jgi:hypothetical protein
MDAAEQELFAGSVRTALERHAGAELAAALADLGWADALDADEASAVSTLFELQGRAGVVSPALDDVIAGALGAGVDATVLLPALGTWAPPGVLTDGRVAVRGLASGSGAGAKSLLVAVDDGRACPVGPGDLEQHPIGGVDPALGLVSVEGRAAAGELVDADWPAALAVGRLALAHELLGAARTMLDLAREHALARVQFGRPIAMFQAVRHRLAETLVAIEAADAVAAAAWEERSPTSAALAKAAAGRAARTAARHCQQVLAGIGFTTEHPFEGYVRRVLVLDQLLGSTRALTSDLGRAVIDARALPPLLAL